MTMARDVAKDFSQLKEFVANYSLTEQSSDIQYQSLLSRQHKLYHSLLTLLSELVHQDWHPLLVEDIRSSSVNQVFRERWLEFSSDIGSALFAWIHGAYKGARLLLRSGIENVIKAFGILEDDRVLTLKNSYEVFEIAKDGRFFSDTFNRTRFDILKQEYSSLSRDVHTATRTEMRHVHSLNYFPQFTHTDAHNCTNVFCTVTRACLESLCLLAQSSYQAMHYRNRDIVNISLSDDVLSKLNRR